MKYPVNGIDKKREQNYMQIGTSSDFRQEKSTDLTSRLVDEGRFVRIITELPDISEEKIKIDLEMCSSSVTISANHEGIQYKTEITIPCEVRFSKKSFSDGILEILLEKIQ